MDYNILKKTIEIASSNQRKFNNKPTEEKIEAKKRPVNFIKGKILDLGGESFYQQFFSGEITSINLPKDIHDIKYENEFDGVLAMHILEHSPCPFYVLLLINRALKKDGTLYVSVPTPENKYFLEMKEHFSVLSYQGWEKLIQFAGFDITKKEDGIFGNYKKAEERRFFCIKR